MAAVIPRGLFMLVGEAISDRLPTHFVAAIAAAINTTLIGLVAIGSGMIALVKTRSHPVAPPVTSSSAASLSGEIMAGLYYAWKQPAIRISLQLIAMINFAVLEPIMIGVAELVTVRFDGSATTFGYLQSAYGIGALLGVVVASRLSAIKDLKMPLALLSALLGAGLIALGFMQQAWMAGVVIALMGLSGGIIGVLGITWLQQQTATHMQGRMMSLVMFASVALDPFSQAISGVLMEINLTRLFVAAGIAMLIMPIGSFLSGSRDRLI